MWIKVAVGNHYGVFEVMGVEMYRESDSSYILYGYLPRPVPQVPVKSGEALRDEMRHTDFVKIFEFDSEAAAQREIDNIQAFINSGAKGVYEVQPGASAEAAA